MVGLGMSRGLTVRISLDQTLSSVNRQLMQNLINAPDGGASLCAGGYNPFGNLPVSASCQSYVTAHDVSATRLQQTIIEANLQGDLARLPAGSLKFAIGASHRANTYGFVPGPVDAASNLVGLPAATPSSGKQRVNEAYAELLAPLLADVFAVKRMELGLAYRLSSYNTSGRLSTYRANLDWQMAYGVSFRGGYSRAARAPSLLELNGAATVGTVNIGTASDGSTNGDPCDFRSAARTGPNGAKVQALCVAQGVPASAIPTYVQSSTSAVVSTSGNPGFTAGKGRHLFCRCGVAP